MEGFFSVLGDMSTALTAGGTFLLYSIIACISALSVIVYALFNKRGKSVSAVFYLAIAFCFFSECALLFSNGRLSLTEALITITATMSVAAFMAMPMALVVILAPSLSDRKVKTISGKEFVRRLRSDMARENLNGGIVASGENKVLDNTLPISNVKNIQANNQKSNYDNLSFSHVKSVIERVNAIELSAQDKRAVRELEISIHNAEKGGLNEQTKINDGLNSLLKIMAKYGV